MVSQLVRSATSVGANYCEANGASSKKDFKNKIFICRKEIQETKYWLELIAESNEEEKENLKKLWEFKIKIIFDLSTEKSALYGVAAYTGLTTNAFPYILKHLPEAPALPFDLVAVKNGDPVQMFDRGIAALGGMGAFVRKGQTVVVKPNIGWDQAPEAAATTNPALVKRIVEHCLEGIELLLDHRALEGGGDRDEAEGGVGDGGERALRDARRSASSAHSDLARRGSGARRR